MRLCSILAAVAATALLSSAVSAATIAFTSGTFTDNTVLALVGTAAQVNTPGSGYAVNFGGATVTTNNNYVFGADDGSNVTRFGGLNAYNGYLGGAASGDSNFDTALANGLYGLAWEKTVTLKNLTIGTTYNVLTLLADTRSNDPGNLADRSITVTDGGANSINQPYAYPAGSPNLGGYVLGTFTANANTQTITQEVFNSNGQTAGAQFNAVLVAAVPEPATLSLLGLGAIGLLSRRRAKKA